MQDFYEHNAKDTKKGKREKDFDSVHNNDDLDSTTTTESDYMELLKSIKKRKLAKKVKKETFQHMEAYVPFQNNKKDEASSIISIDGSTTPKSNVRYMTQSFVPNNVPKLSTTMDEQAIRERFSSSWSNLSINGGYQVKLQYVKVPSSAQYYPVVVEVSNNSGQLNIYIKGRTFVEVLKGFAHEISKHCSDIAAEINLPFFIDIIQNSQFIDVRKIPYGPNEYKAGHHNNREYKDHVMFFMFPKEKGYLTEVMDRFKIFLQTVFSSTHFFILMESYTKLIPNQGGDIGKHLRVKDSEAWKILKNSDNYVNVWMDSLDAKLMDEDINKVLMSMFPNESHKEAYQRIGWKCKISSPWSPPKKGKLGNDGS